MCRLVIMGDILLTLNWDMSLGYEPRSLFINQNFSVTEPKINFREESSGPYPIPQIHILSFGHESPNGLCSRIHRPSDNHAVLKFSFLYYELFSIEETYY